MELTCGQVEFLGLNVRDQAATTESFVRAVEVPYPTMVDGGGSMVSLLSSVLSLQTIPSTVLLDATGRTAAGVVGAVTKSTLTGLIEDALTQ